MKFNAILLTAVILLTLIAGSAIDFSSFSRPETHTETRSSPAAPQAVVPDFEFKTLSGKSSRLSDYKGRVIVLNFWASWCAPCVAEFPLLLSLAAAMPDQMTLIAMTLDNDSEDLNRFLKRHGENYQSLPNVVIALDPDRSISQNIFSTFRLPETIIIAPDGSFHRKIVGYSDEWKGKEMQEEILSLPTP